MDFCSQIDYAATGRTRLRKEDKSAIMSISVKIRVKTVKAVTAIKNCLLAGWVQYEDNREKAELFFACGNDGTDDHFDRIVFCDYVHGRQDSGNCASYKLCGAGARWHAANGKI